MCHGLAHRVSTFASRNINIKAMNTENTFACISSMLSSESSYRTLLDMINEMDLELTGVSLV